MSAEPNPDLPLEIAHLLLIDVVGYSKLLVNEQIELLQILNRVVRSTECFRLAEKEGKLIRVPTGDGMALLFFRSPEEPARCALEISRGLKEHPEIQIRMGIHSGPINQVTDVNDRVNVAGTGINVAQRIMDFGDAGHILLSKHVADDLAQYRHWKPFLRDLGEYEAKHGLRLHVVSLCKDGAGNATVPQKLSRGAHRWRKSEAKAKPVSAPRWPKTLLAAALVLSLIALAVSFFILFRRGAQPSKTATGVREKSIAVLPFENLSDEKQNAYFTDGVQDEILSDLAKVADLKVISRTSVMQYRNHSSGKLSEIAKALGVTHVVEGSVQRAAGRVRVNAQLIDARTDIHVWGDHYDGDLADVFAIQSAIAKSIADQLQAKISASERTAMEKPPTFDIRAFEFYQEAKTLWGDVSDPIRAREKLPEAARLLGAAVARDPNFLLAWCLLSRTQGAIYTHYDHTQSRLDQAQVALQTAVRLQPEAGEAHLAQGIYYYQGFRDYQKARTELAFAQRTLPNSAEVFLYQGLVDRRQGRWEEAEQNLQRALDLDPRNLFTLQQLALTYFAERRYAEELQMWNRVLKIAPGDPITRISQAQVALHCRADIDSYQKTLATLIAENPSIAPDVDYPDYALCERSAIAAARTLKNYPPKGVNIFGASAPLAYWEGVFAHYQRDNTKARIAFTAAREEVEKSMDQQNFAAALSLLGLIDAGLGKKQEALQQGQQACELLPISQDAIEGVFLAINLAQIYAMTGENNLAIEQIAAVESVPNELSYGLLKLQPYWDPLRGDPRFEKIVASLAPRP